MRAKLVNSNVIIETASAGQWSFTYGELPPGGLTALEVVEADVARALFRPCAPTPGQVESLNALFVEMETRHAYWLRDLEALMRKR